MAFFPMKKSNKEFFPIGYVYISVSDVNPSTYFGGTWEAFATGKTLVGINTSDSDFDTVQKTGGAKTHTLTAAQLPNLTGSANLSVSMTTQGTEDFGFSSASGILGVNKYSENRRSVNGGVNSGKSGALTINFGGGQAHNNLQPYVVVYMWKRIA